jgi:hypothetical protein
MTAEKYRDNGRPMTPKQYRNAMKCLGFSSHRAMAEFLGISLRSSHGYANGEPIPTATAMPLRLMHAIAQNGVSRRDWNRY